MDDLDDGLELEPCISEEVIDVAGALLDFPEATSNSVIDDADLDICDEQSAPCNGNTGKKMKTSKYKKNGKPNDGEIKLNDRPRDTISTVRKWEKRPVRIKTLEGEFSVLVWTTGNA